MEPEANQHDISGKDLATTQGTASPQGARDLAGVTKRVFLGEQGLRALWRLLIFVAILFVLHFAIGFFLQPAKKFTEGFSAQTVMLWDGLRFVSVLIAAAIMGYFEKRSLADYGLPWRNVLGLRFWEGAAWGFATQSATILVLYVAGNASFDGLHVHGRAALYFGVMWAGAFIAVGLFEEFLFRGYPQFTLSHAIGFWPAAFLLSGLFWFAHMANPGENWIGGLEAALAAITFCLTLWLTGNLWFAIGMHAGWDWTETYFFGVADSGLKGNGYLLNTSLTGSKWMTGGSVGPEGSVVGVVVILLVMALLVVRFPRILGLETSQPDQPREWRPAA
jgi:membrane protease YdiL (CAAX protease family)